MTAAGGQGRISREERIARGARGAEHEAEGRAERKEER